MFIPFNSLTAKRIYIYVCKDSIVRGLETIHVSASLAVGTPRYIVDTYRELVDIDQTFVIVNFLCSWILSRLIHTVHVG